MKRATSSRLEKAINLALQQESAKLYRPYEPENSRSYGCSVNGCPNLAYAKGLCNAHYIRSRNGGDMEAPLRNRRTGAECLECGEPVGGKGGWNLCKAHYRTRRRQIIRRVSIEALGNCCQRCAGQFPDYVYDFHHIQSDDKIHALGNAVDAISVRAYAEEVTKCVLLCANCHRIEHAEQRGANEQYHGVEIPQD